MNKKILAIIVLVFVGGVAYFYIAHRNSSSQSNYLVQNKAGISQTALAAKFDYLSQQKTNACGGGKNYVAWLSEDGKRLQGSCCGPMTFHSYEEQVEGLKKYADYEIIPPDPYDVSAKWADQMMEYAEQSGLTPTQQAIYDKAAEISIEGGPCCCVCWHWDAYEGLAKHLIINQNFSAEQIAEVWDLSDACGGEHAHTG